MTSSLVVLLATGFGLGWLPWMPGTFGALLGIPLAWWLLRQSMRWQLVCALALVAVAIPLCHAASAALGGGDASAIVADEFLAFPLAVIGIGRTRRALYVGIAFVLFRIVDIAKLPPVGLVESIGGGLGIALDDVVAALIVRALLALWIVLGRRDG